MLGLLEKITNLENLPLYTWSVTAGLRRRMRTEFVAETSDLTLALRHIEKTVQNGVYVLLDAQPYLQDPINLRLVREIALTYNNTPRTLVFVSPRLELPAELLRMSARFELALLDPAGVMYAGRVVERAPTARLFAHMRMPYTSALLAAIPKLDSPPHTALPAIAGRPPDATRPMPGCSFAPRCKYADGQCQDAKPPLVDPGRTGSQYACWHPL